MCFIKKKSHLCLLNNIAKKKQEKHDVVLFKINLWIPFVLRKMSNLETNFLNLIFVLFIKTSE